TTGVPKGAVLSHQALVANIRQSRSWNPTLVEGLERGVDVMPLFHVYGLTVIMGVSIATGSAMVLIPRFDLEHVLLAIQKHRPRSFAGAPRIYVAAASAPDLARYDLRSVEVFQSGSAPLPVEVQTKFEQLAGGGRVLEGYAIGVPDPERGEIVKAFVVLRPGASVRTEELRTHCASSLARFKIPADIEFRSDLPKSMVGKVLRRALADEERASRAGSE